MNMDADAMNRANFMKAQTAFAIMSNEMSRKTTPEMLDRIAQRVLTQAKKNAPVDTGALRASGRVKRINQFRRRVEFGGAGTGVDYAQAVEFGTIRNRPKPFLEPALRKVLKQTPAITKPSVKKWLQKLIKIGSS